jgi:hypothetical protein
LNEANQSILEHRESVVASDKQERKTKGRQRQIKPTPPGHDETPEDQEMCNAGERNAQHTFLAERVTSPGEITSCFNPSGRAALAPAASCGALQ